MSTDDPTLQRIGNDVLRGFVAMIGETIFLTIYAVLVVNLGSATMAKERRQHRPYILMVAILTLFLLALVMWALDVAKFVTEFKTALVQSGNGLTIEDKLEDSLALIYPLTAAQDALYSYMCLLGDAIVVYRVWTLQAYHRLWIFWIPCICLLGSLVATVMLTYCVAVTGSGIVLGSFEHPAFCKNVQKVTYIVPCFTTAIVTVLIGIMTWKYHTAMKNLRDNLNATSSTRTSPQNQVVKILVLLIESGLCYFLFFVAQAVESPRLHAWVEKQSALSFSTLFQYCTSIIVGFYPTTVLLLAQSKHTVVETISTDNRNLETSDSTLEPISFRTHARRGEDEIELRDVLGAPDNNTVFY